MTHLEKVLEELKAGIWRDSRGIPRSVPNLPLALIRSLARCAERFSAQPYDHQQQELWCQIGETWRAEIERRGAPRFTPNEALQHGVAPCSAPGCDRPVAYIVGRLRKMGFCVKHHQRAELFTKLDAKRVQRDKDRAAFEFNDHKRQIIARVNRRGRWVNGKALTLLPVYREKKR